jgi:hypothetical protein
MRIGIDADVVAEMRKATAGAVPILNILTFGQTGSEKTYQATRRNDERCQYPFHRPSRMPHEHLLYSPVEYSSRDLALFTFRSRARHVNVYWAKAEESRASG